MESIFEAINEWIKELLIGAINGNLSNMFGDINEKVGTIAAQAGQTPQGWNAGVFNMIQNLSQSVILPLAGRRTVISAATTRNAPMTVRRTLSAPTS